MRANRLTIGLCWLWALPCLGGWMLDGQLLAPDVEINAIDLSARTWANDASGRVTTLAAVALTNAAVFDASGAAASATGALAIVVRAEQASGTSAVWQAVLAKGYTPTSSVELLIGTATGTVATALRAEQAAGTQGVLAAVAAAGYLTSNSYAPNLVMSVTAVANVTTNVDTNTVVSVGALWGSCNGVFNWAYDSYLGCYVYQKGSDYIVYSSGGGIWNMPQEEGAGLYYSSGGSVIGQWNAATGQDEPAPTVSYLATITTNWTYTTNLTISGNLQIVLPTTTNGLSSGALWNSNGTVNVRP